VTLVALLAKERGLRNRKDLPSLTEEQILAWAQAHHARTGQWPGENSGAVAEAPGEVWVNVNEALRQGLRGLDGGDTLARLLARRLGVRNSTNAPPLTNELVLTWADAFFGQHGCWPKANSGPVGASPGDTWQAVDDALRAGLRGLPAGSSLARLLAARRGVRNKGAAPPLSVEQILAWADEHRRRTGRWPWMAAGPIPDSGGETWCGVYMALRHGRRGLPGGDSLVRLLERHRGTAAGQGDDP
jgi:hypothetical protein